MLEDSQQASQPPPHELAAVGAGGGGAGVGAASAPASQVVVTSKNAAFTSKTSARVEGWLKDQPVLTKPHASIRRPIRARIHELFRNRHLGLSSQADPGSLGSIRSLRPPKLPSLSKLRGLLTVVRCPLSEKKE